MSDEIPVIRVEEAWAVWELVAWHILPAPTFCRIMLEGPGGTVEFEDAHMRLTGWLNSLDAWVFRTEGPELWLRVTRNDVQLKLELTDPDLTGFLAAWTAPR